jgi:uncharacterized membrane protein
VNDGGDPVNPWMAFIWDTQSGFTDFGLMEGPSSTGLAISEDGTVAGWTGVGNADAGDNAFVNAQGNTTVLPYIAGGTSSAAATVNSSGVIAGFGRIPIADFPFFRFRAFVHTNGSMIEIPPFEGFRHSFAVNVNESGLVIGFSRFLLDGTDDQRPFVWRNGEVFDLNQIIDPKLEFTMRFVESINETAQIAGKGTLKGTPVACILTPAIVGDLNGSCTVDVDDLLLLINNWGDAGSIADANRDGSVNSDDLVIVINNWTLQ